MESSKRGNPPASSWLLPAQGFAAAVAIYSSVYIFGVGTLPFIMSVFEAGLPFLLGMYFCLTQRRPGSCTSFPSGSLYAAALYHCARHVGVVVNLPESALSKLAENQPLLRTWTKVGCAMSALNV
ncbi:hypothetical protein VTK56DRAFT_5358 [Thermocarpiscus australiensis]